MSGPGIAEGFVNQGSYTPDNLLAGEFPRVTRIVTIAGSQVLNRGAVLGRVEREGHYTLCALGASDGSEIPEAILAATVDTTNGNVQAPVYLSGEFHAEALTLGVGFTMVSMTPLLRQRTIFIRTMAEPSGSTL